MNEPHDFQLTFGRANEHLNSLEEEIARYLAGNPYDLVGNFEGQRLEFVIRAVVRTPPPPRIKVLTGEVVANLRASLNQLSYLLATDAETGDAPSGTEFPIFTDRSAYHATKKDGTPTRGSGVYKTRGMDSVVQAAIDGMQPYDRPHDPLMILHRLRITHEHKRLNVLGHIASGASFVIHHMSGVDVHLGELGHNLASGPFRDGATVARFSVRPTRPDPVLQVETMCAFGVSLANEGPASGAPVLDCLERIRDAVRETVFAQLAGFV